MENLQNETVREKGPYYNPALVDLIDKARGVDRTLRKYVNAAGVSPANISRIKNGEYKASPATLQKLTSEKAQPRAGVTFEEMMVAAGYLNDAGDKYFEMQGDFEFLSDESFSAANGPKEQMNKVDDTGEVQQEAIQETTPEAIQKATPEAAPEAAPEATQKSTQEATPGENRDVVRERYMPSHRVLFSQERRREAMMYEAMATGIVFQTLTMRGVKFSNAQEMRRGRYRPDLALDIADEKIKRWWFEFRTVIDIPEDRLRMRSFEMLTSFFRAYPDMERKITFVVNSEVAYNSCLGYKNEIPYKGDLSIAYLNPTTMKIEKEQYLSRYKDNDYEADIYLIDSTSAS